MFPASGPHTRFALVDGLILILLGLSRAAIFTAVEASLKRLDMDYIDLLQIHRFDKNTPIEETMEALHDLVKSGKVRYIGASSMWTYQFAMMQAVADKRGWTKFVSMQNHYNLLYREEEREMNKFCNETGVGLIPVRFSYSLPAPSGSTRRAVASVTRSVDADWMVTRSGRLSAVAISPGH